MKSGYQTTIFVVRSLLVLAIMGDIWLGWHALNSTVVSGCGGNAGCGDVLASKWAYAFGVPVSIPALFIHLGLLVSTFSWAVAGMKNFRVAMAFILGCIVLLSAIWFILLQAVALGRYCVICMSIHATGALAAVLLLKDIPKVLGVGKIVMFAGASFAVFLLLPFGQMRFAKSLLAKTHSDAEMASDFVLGAGIGEVRAQEFPYFGDPESTQVAAMVFDFTCTHCRVSAAAMKKYFDAEKRDLCVILLPTALDPACNSHVERLRPEHAESCDYARLAIGLWKISPQEFAAFCDLHLKLQAPPPVAEATAWAHERVGEKRLEEVLADPDVERILERNVAVYGNAVKISKQPKMPKIITHSAIISGAPDSVEGFEGIFKR